MSLLLVSLDDTREMAWLRSFCLGNCFGGLTQAFQHFVYRVYVYEPVKVSCGLVSIMLLESHVEFHKFVYDQQSFRQKVETELQSFFGTGSSMNGIYADRVDCCIQLLP